jgi:hypothetical protein
VYSMCRQEGCPGEEGKTPPLFEIEADISDQKNVLDFYLNH